MVYIMYFLKNHRQSIDLSVPVKLMNIIEVANCLENANLNILRSIIVHFYLLIRVKALLKSLQQFVKDYVIRENLFFFFIKKANAKENL